MDKRCISVELCGKIVILKQEELGRDQAASCII